MAKIQITGGGFQDGEGNVLANGYLIFELSQDCQVSATGQICSGIILNVPLDGSGNVSGTVLIWPNDQLSPSNNYYTVTGYTANGQKAWGPNIQQVIGAGPFNLNGWVPNALTNWTPSPLSVTLQTNEVANGSQTLLDLHSGTNITITDSGSGRVTIAGPSAFGRPYNGGFQQYATLVNTGGLGSGSLSELAATATEPISKQEVVTQTNPTCYASLYDTLASITLGILADFQIRVKPVIGNSFWLWIGLQDQVLTPPNASTIFNTDSPNVNFVGFRYATDQDTHWKAYASQSSSLATAVDTGVALDTTQSHLFEIKQKVAGTILFLIDGVQVASINSNVPAAGTQLGFAVIAMQGGSSTQTVGWISSNWAWTFNK